MKVLILTFFILLCVTQNHQVNSEPTNNRLRWLERKLQEITRSRENDEYQDPEEKQVSTQLEILDNILQNGVLRSLR